MIINPFTQWNFMDRAMARGICFKGDDEIEETAAQVEAEKVAIDQYNTYMKEYRPFEKKFIADVMKPTALREDRVAGQVNADIAQKSAVPVGTDPARLLRTPNGKAAMSARATNEAISSVKEQKVKGMQAISDIGMGKETEAQLGYEDLASDALKTAIVGKQADVATDNAITSGIMGAVGAGTATYANTRPTIGNGSTTGNWTGPYAGKDMFAGDLR